MTSKENLKGGLKMSDLDNTIIEDCKQDGCSKYSSVFEILLKEYKEIQNQIYKLTFIVDSLSLSIKSLEQAQKYSNESVLAETENLENLQKKLLELSSTQTAELVQESIKKQWTTRRVVTLLDRITIVIGAIIAIIGTILASGGLLK